MNHPLAMCPHGQLGADCTACPHTHPDISQPLWAAVAILALLTIGHAIRRNIHVPHY